ncbi:MAG: hypothetical protein FWD69_10595 [Polyangiaceae bacterium]|nr:hypothetical protein [Polyangiaceae bacterium]
MTDDRENEEVPNDRENEGNADANITDMSEIPFEVVDEWLDELGARRRTEFAQREKLEIDTKNAPKKKKFAEAKRRKEKLKADYELPPDDRQLATTAGLPLLAPSEGEAEETTVVMPGNNRPTPVPPPTESPVETQETTVPMVMGMGAAAIPNWDRSTPTMPPPKPADAAPAPETTGKIETKGNTERMPAVVPGSDHPPSLPANLDKITSPETPASKRAKMQPVAPEADTKKEHDQSAVASRAIPVDLGRVPTPRMPPMKEAVKEERVGSRHKWGVYALVAATIFAAGLVAAVMLRKDDKSVVEAKASTASVVPVAVSRLPPSATSSPVVQVAESDASDVAPTTPTPTVTVPRKPMVRRQPAEGNQKVAPQVATVSPPVVTAAPSAVTAAPSAVTAPAPVPTAAKPVERASPVEFDAIIREKH